MKSKKMKFSGGRTFDQVRIHYEVEKAIAARLKKATMEERKTIYQTMYDELFKKVPDHPRLTRRKDKKLTLVANKSKLNLVNRFINKSTDFAEFGAGDCIFATSICRSVRFVYGIDISDQIGLLENIPDNFELMIYDGYNLKMQPDSVHVVFSDQLIEHLHPEDTESHFELVKKILKKKGIYIFRTPHRFSGPHDISRYFSDKAEGFHLKEWTYSEIAKILKKLKYSSWAFYWNAKGIHIKMPLIYFYFVEKILKRFPGKYRRLLARYFLPCILIVAIK